jgi:coenzyme Q-binding protein COQ10
MRVRRAPEDLFDLVADVRTYPRFVPFIAAMRVLSESWAGEGVKTLTAETAVGYKFLRETFTTQVVLDRPQLKIDVSYLSGPFEALGNHWIFEQLPDGSTMMDFCVEYEFRNPVLRVVFEGARGRAAHMILDAFAREAERRYPTPVGDDRNEAGA